MKIVIVDYGMGNIKSISSSLTYLGINKVVLSADFEEMKSADKLLLPGVGSFGEAMKKIKANQIDQYLHQLVTVEKKPLLGICLGMQLMGLSSNEDGDNTGLGLVETMVTRFECDDLKIPHVGFNQVKITDNSRLYSGFNSNPDFYFTHSYRMMGSSSINASYCDYGVDFIASFEMENIAGTQFHPELSQNNGLALLKNFIEKF